MGAGMSTFNAVVPKDFDELMFLFWVENECLDSALIYRDEEFLDLAEKTCGREYEFTYEKLADGGDDKRECFFDNSIDHYGFVIPVYILEVKS